MMFAHRRLTLLMLPMLLAAGACADRAENATGRAALDRQLNRAQQADTSMSEPASVPSRSVLRQKAATPALQPATAQPTTGQPVTSQPTAGQPAANEPAASQPAVPAASVSGKRAVASQAAPAERPAPSAEQPAVSGPSLPVTASAPASAEAADSAAPQAAPVPTARTPRTVAMTVPIGAVLSVSLNQELSTRDNHAGDMFSTTLQEPFVEGSTVLLPAGAVIQGRVTAAQQSTRVGRTAVLKLAFESVSFDGHSYPLSATVMEANPERRSRASTTETAGKIAAGAAAGALLGRILGKDTRSTVAGAAMGAAAGTAIALGTQDVDAVLPKDSRMVIRVDRPVIVEVKVP